MCLSAPPCGCRPIFCRACAKLSFIPKIVCISTTRNTALEWCSENAAVTVIPAEAGEQLGADFIIKKISNLEADVYKTVVKVKDRPLSIAAQHFLKFYAETRNSQQVCDLEQLLKEEAL